MINKQIKAETRQPVNSPYQRPHDKFQDVVVHVDGDSGLGVVRRALSTRWRRGMFTLSITALTFGLLMILISTPSIRNEVLAPGGLCSAHARILAEQGTDRCAACHAAAHQSLSSWVSTTIWGPPASQPTQSELCLKCHSQSLGNDFAMNPHNVAPAVLAQMTDAVSSTTTPVLGGWSRMPPPVYDGKIACSACHREHQGNQQSLSALTDSQCQGCHENVFHSFETDHPEFTSYPLKRRSKIAFDHASHFGKHYPARNKDFACAQCHTSDDGNDVQTLASFEHACAECHKQGVDASTASGLALIALPILDVDAIENYNASIGSWPMAATGDFDGPLPPLMRILLSADPQAAKVLKSKDDRFDFSDFDASRAADVEQSVTLVWAIKRLMFEMARDGESSIARRIQVVTGETLNAEQLSRLVQSLDTHALRNAAMRWLPDLQAEVGEQVPVYEASFKLQKQFEQQLARSRQSFQLKNSSELALAKIVSEFARQQIAQTAEVEGSEWLAENPLKGRSNPIAAKADAPVEAIVQQSPDSNSKSIPGSKSAGTAVPKSTPDTQGPVAETQMPASTRISQGSLEDSQWLAKNPLAKDSRSGRAPETVKVLETEAKPESDVGKTAGNRSPEKIKWTTELPPINQGWLRDDQTFQLRYQPAGHADLVLQNWIELIGKLPESETASALKPAFDRLFSLDGVGDCRRCHTADRQPDHSLLVNWKGEYRNPEVAGFTKFSHGPHLTLPKLRDCSQCHQLETDRPTFEAYAGYESEQAASNFAPLKVADCASCHRTGSVGNSCTQCHNYHVGQAAIAADRE